MHGYGRFSQRWAHIMDCNLLSHASLGLHNYFDTHQAECHDTVFNHCFDVIMPYRYVCVCARVCVRVRVCVCV